MQNTYASSKLPNVGELGPVFQRAELTFGQRVVVAQVRSAMALRDAEIGEQERDGLGDDRPAVIGVHSELRQCGDGYATGPTELWGEHGNLLAIAHQTAHLRWANFAAGP